MSGVQHGRWGCAVSQHYLTTDSTPSAMRRRRPSGSVSPRMRQRRAGWARGGRSSGCCAVFAFPFDGLRCNGGRRRRVCIRMLETRPCHSAAVNLPYTASSPSSAVVCIVVYCGPPRSLSLVVTNWPLSTSVAVYTVQSNAVRTRSMRRAALKPSTMSLFRPLACPPLQSTALLRFGRFRLIQCWPAVASPRLISSRLVSSRDQPIPGRKRPLVECLDQHANTPSSFVTSTR